MGTRDPRVDAYIEKSLPFARPVLAHLREVVHAACPRVEETIKWGFPHFMYEGMLCSMASFKAHCAFGFWKGALIVGEGTGEAMGQFGRIASVKDLPSKKVLAGYVKQAMALNESRVKAPARAKPRTAKPEPVAPPELLAALERDKRAAANFAAMPPTHRREYIEWISEAKRQETREKRMAQALEWIGEGKSRNWKYEAC